jgi:hypothetical protein
MRGLLIERQHLANNAIPNLFRTGSSQIAAAISSFDLPSFFALKATR